jgi:uncharacterized delta-60 repeat protein
MPSRSRTVALFALVFLALAAASPAAAAPLLKPDPSFGPQGFAEPQLPPHFGYTSFRALSVQPDGSLLAGRHDARGGEGSLTYRRYDAAGNLDPSYESTSEGPVYEVAEADGKILRLNGNGISRYNPDGSQDKSYGIDPANGQPFSDLVYSRIEALILTPSQKPILAGSIPEDHEPEAAGVEQIVLVRFDRQGSFDPGFGGDGMVELETEAGVAAEGFVDVRPHGEEGALVLVDGARRLRGEEQEVTPGGSAVVALGGDGRPEPGFGDGGIVRSDSSIEAYSPLPDGGLVLTGNRWGEQIRPGSPRTSDVYATRLTAAGKYDPGFGGDGTVIVGFGGLDLSQALLTEPDGSMLIGGSSAEMVDSLCLDFSSYCRETPVLAHLLPNGELDPGFGDGGRVRLEALSEPFVPLAAGRGVRALASLPDGGVVAGGGSGVSAFLAELDSGGALVPGFGEGGIAIERDAEKPESQPHALAIDGRERILLAGATNAERLPSRGNGAVFRFRPNGALDRTYGSGAGFVRVPGTTRDISLGPEGDAFVLSGRFGPNLVVHLTPDGALDRRFGRDGVAREPELPPAHRNGRRQARSLALRSIVTLPAGGVLVAGQGGSGAERRIILLRYGPHGHLVPSFGDDGIAIVDLGLRGECDPFRLKLRRNGRILIAGQVLQRGEFGWRPALFQLLPDGSPDRSFGRGGVAKVNLPSEGTGLSLAILADGSTLLGGRQITRKGPKPFLLRFGRHGGLDRRFARQMWRTAPAPSRRTVLSPREILPTGAGIFTVSREEALLAFSPRGGFRGAVPFDPEPKPRRRLISGALQGGRPLLVGQVGRIGWGRRIVMRRYLAP